MTAGPDTALEAGGRPLTSCGKELTLNPKLWVGTMGAILAGVLTRPGRVPPDVAAELGPGPTGPEGSG